MRAGNAVYEGAHIGEPRRIRRRALEQRAPARHGARVITLLLLEEREKVASPRIARIARCRCVEGGKRRRRHLPTGRLRERIALRGMIGGVARVESDRTRVSVRRFGWLA